MFEHAYGSYKKYAFPEDELMPLSCKGRRRGRERSRGDMDDSLGNFSLTLIDSLDTLPVLGMIDEFNSAVKYTVNNVNFDAELVISVFETNIRIVGGLVGAHTMMLKLKADPTYSNKFKWYNNQLIKKAVTIANKLAPAFDTNTGLPRSRVSMKSEDHANSFISSEQRQSTCTACAGTMLMEFSALSYYRRVLHK